MFPPVPAARIEAGYADFAERWNPVLDVFDEVGVRFAHEVHPGEIAYDYWTTHATLVAIGHREAFGLNWDPSHVVWQQIDLVGFLWDFRDRIYHVDWEDTRMKVGNGRGGRLSSHLPWRDPRRGWDFVSTSHGDVAWEDCFRTLTAIGYSEPISIEWEDAGMDRLVGAVLAVMATEASDPSREPLACMFDGGKLVLRDGVQAGGDEFGVDEAGVKERAYKVPVLLAEGAKLGDAEVLLVQAQPGELGSPRRWGCVEVLHLDQPVPPACRQDGSRQVDPVDAETVLILEGGPLASYTLDLVRESGSLFSGVGDGKDVHSDRHRGCRREFLLSVGAQDRL